MNKVDLSQYQNTIGRKKQIIRLIWVVVWAIFVRPFPRSMAKNWKQFLLRLFGAKIHKTANIYSSVRIYMPWNLEMAAYSCLSPEVDCYNVAKIYLGENSIVSQKSYLCAASHDISKNDYPLITAPIIIEDQAWVGAGAYVGMGVTIGEGAVVGATASVYKNVEPWTVVGGNPAKFIKNRIIKD